MSDDKIQRAKDEASAEEALIGASMCEYHDWFSHESVLCSHGLFNNTRCVLNEGECPHRQMSTEVTCECFIKEDKDSFDSKYFYTGRPL